MIKQEHYIKQVKKRGGDSDLIKVITRIHMCSNLLILEQIKNELENDGCI